MRRVVKKSKVYFKNNELLDLFSDQFSLKSFKDNIDHRTDESDSVLNAIDKAVSKKNDKDDVKLVVNLTDEQKQAYADGTLKLDVDKDGNMYAQLKNNGKYGKKLNISEDLEKQDLEIADARFSAELNAIKDQLAKMVEALEAIEEYVVEVLQGLHNDRIGLFYSGLGMYLEASQMENSPIKELLISQAIKSLNDSQAQVMQEFKSNIVYLKNHEYKNEKSNRQKKMHEKMDSIHKCFEIIYRAILLKAIIYFDIKQLPSMLMVFEEYRRFVETMVKPNASFLIECDPREDMLINTIWQKRASSFMGCEEAKAQLLQCNTYYITKED
ncbi:MAG: hypothetical protein IJJ00_04570 [Erysipelotrichaceae bacterium]|nr:hypothetical protein [Erysipelotrichaceae bacterium]